VIRSVIGSLFLILGSCLNLFAQAQNDYLDIFTAAVKPEKRDEFDSVIKRMVDANRRHKGDTWLALERVYGPGNTVSFVSPRKNYAEAESAYEMFMDSLRKAYGEAGVGKLMQDFSNTVTGSHSELRRRRWDLSVGVPPDAAGIVKQIGETRWIRTLVVRLRPGRTADYENLRLMIKAAAERSSKPVPVYVSQGVAGQHGMVFYVSTLAKSMATFDEVSGLSNLLGKDSAEYARYLKTVAEVTLDSEVSIYRVLPELSAASEEIMSASPEFWQPKPVAAK
jgi:hypothetical protein